LDAYVKAARLTPAYLVVSPAAVLVIAAALGTSDWWKKLIGVLAACGVPILLAEWGRSAGRRKQEALFAAWGGAPTTYLLRFRTGGSKVARRHTVVERATKVELPATAEEEAADPSRADERYEEAVDVLRERTRDEKKFHLVHEEVTSYGFRRNLWGRKPWGIAISLTVLAASAALLATDVAGHNLVPWPGAAVGAAYAGTVLCVWILMVTTDWVHVAAMTYANQLLDSAEILAREAEESSA
jgi:hypothetical protein